MPGYLLVFFCGVLFAAGLGLSGMTLPQKVIGFLDFAGEWDPSLALVMVGSAGVYFVFYRRIIRRAHPLFDVSFHVPTRTDIDQRLIVGAALFGIGWGLVGFCPGPALTALVSGYDKALIFFVAMVTGMYAYRTVDAIAGLRTDEGTAVDG
ncbi:MAG: YeeE/YedE family protein [Thiohalocapsa sp.]|nr:YeeE/YedE family protein [Thiohalocapsa sp.]